MGSKKRQAQQRQIAAFKAQLGTSADDPFARERERTAQSEREHDAALRRKACESKQRYASHAEAQATLEACEEHGARNLRIYRCPYCNGWHLTSHAWE